MSHDVPSLIVTLDGPGGTGKSTVSREIAKRAGLPHLDTGAFYRAATLAVLEAGVDPSREDLVMDVLSPLDFRQDSGRTYIDERDVTDEIRSDPVTRAVSAVSSHPGVRERLVAAQRAWIERRGRSGVVEGRDIGSVVFPDADLKIYLDASAEERAKRRARETGEDQEVVLAELNRRDRLDSTRAASPLQVPEGAVVVDTSDMTLDQVVEHLLGLIRAKS